MSAKRASNSKKVPFTISLEQIANVALSDIPIPVSEISKRLNAVVHDENMKTLSYRDIRDWLESIQMLRVVKDQSGKAKRFPTEEGIRLGISVEMRQGSQGTYQVVLYSHNAQQFILDNIDSVLERLRV